jgi:sarcosine oxidase, subunit gamma
MNARPFSPLHDALQGEKAFPRSRWGDVRGMAVPLQLGEPAREAELAKVLALADASFLPRLVVKGPQAASFLEARGVTIPPDLLGVGPLESGGLIARTGSSEFFLEDGVAGNVVDRVQTSLGSGQKGVYRVLRQDAALILSGALSGELFRHVCSYDFIGEPHSRLVFTQVAGLSCSVLRQELNEIPVFRLWTDGTYGIYIWRTLLEIAAELGGGAVGTAVFFPALLEARQP